MAAPTTSRSERYHGPSRHGITTAAGGCLGSTVATVVAAVVAVAVIGAALRGCSEEFDRPTAPPVGVTAGTDGQIILAVPSCAPPATAIALYPLAGADSLWRVQSDETISVGLVVVGSVPDGFQSTRELQPLPTPDTRLRLAISFDSAKRGQETSSTSGTGEPSTAGGGGGSGSVLVSSEVVFRQEDLRPGLIWVGDENVDADAFGARACPEPG